MMGGNGEMMLSNELINLMKQLIKSNSVYDKYTMLLEFQIENGDQLDLNQFKELIAEAKKLKDEKVAIGKEHKANGKVAKTKSKPTLTKEVLPATQKSKGYKHGQFFLDYKGGDACASNHCIDNNSIIPAGGAYRHKVDNKYNTYHADPACLSNEEAEVLVNDEKWIKWNKQNNKANNENK